MSLEGIHYSENLEKTAEISQINETVLPHTEINDMGLRERTGCENLYSYGNAEKMAEKMDYIQGDIDMGAKGTCSLVSTRNLLTLCGISNVTEKEIAAFTKIHNLADWGDFQSAENRGGVFFNEALCAITKEYGVKTEFTPYSKEAVTADIIADKLDHGYRGLFFHNSKILNGSSDSEKHCDHVATFESAIRDGKTGNVVGFFVCDSGYSQAKRFVPADGLLNSMKVQRGGILFTDKPYYADDTTERITNMSTEKYNANETGETKQTYGLEFPTSMEKYIADVMSKDPETVSRTAGERYWDDKDHKTVVGLYNEFYGDKDAFIKDHADYVLRRENMMHESPHAYEFFRNRVYHGHEFPVREAHPTGNTANDVQTIRDAGMDKFMENTAPKDSVDVTSDTNPAKEAEKMAQVMETENGASSCEITAMRNTMALCGRTDISNGDIEKYILDNNIIKSADNLDTIFQGTSGISLERVEGNEATADMIADKLDKGYRGMCLCNYGLCMGVVAADRNSADSAVTFETAVRGTDRKVEGFYVCDSLSGKSVQLVKADDLESSLKVKNGNVYFTEEQY